MAEGAIMSTLKSTPIDPFAAMGPIPIDGSGLGGYFFRLDILFCFRKAARRILGSIPGKTKPPSFLLATNPLALSLMLVLTSAILASFLAFSLSFASASPGSLAFFSASAFALDAAASASRWRLA